MKAGISGSEQRVKQSPPEEKMLHGRGSPPSLPLVQAANLQTNEKAEKGAASPEHLAHQ